MKTILRNVTAVLAAIEAGDFCDCGHYYCPQPRHEGGYTFPSGAVLTPDGGFRGPQRLYESLTAIPEDYRPSPVNPRDRYPQRADGLDPFGELSRRNCADLPNRRN